MGCEGMIKWENDFWLQLISTETNYISILLFLNCYSMMSMNYLVKLLSS